jgi:Protein of unknown function (DUF3105)
MSRRAGRTAREAAERRAQRRQLLGIAAAVVAVLVIGAVALALLGGGSGGLDTEAAPVENYPYPELKMFPPDPGSSIVDLPGATSALPPGRRHIPVGQAYDDYNSNPPTSGPHTATVTPGIYDEPVPKEAVVHNMEHGQVVVWYNCSGGTEPLTSEQCQQLRNDLASVVNESNGGKVVMTPYPNMDPRIALTAWQFLDAFDEFDADRVRTFVDTFYCHTNLEGFC